MATPASAASRSRILDNGRQLRRHDEGTDSRQRHGNPAGPVSFHLSFPGNQTGFKGRGRSRPDLHPGCIEKLPDREFLKWIWDYPKTRLLGVLQLLEGVMHEKKVVILRSNADVARFLDTLEMGRTQGSTQ